MKVGILLANLGTPAAPTTKAVRRYLAEFLKDPRVIELPRWLWLPLLHGIILNVRPRKSAQLYKKIWTDQGSPLQIISQQQADALQIYLDQHQANTFCVKLGMRYGKPNILEALDFFQQQQIEHLLIFPLYPQYSSTSTASVFDCVFTAFRTWRKLPTIHTILNYATHPQYIHVLAARIRNHWTHHAAGEKIIFSFHGIPKRNVQLGDPYEQQCRMTAQLVAEKLQLTHDQWLIAFQSRFGYQQWLEPYCDNTLQQLAKQGIKSVDIICPGFAADCLETLEEIAQTHTALFKKAGGEQLHYIPALNAERDHIKVLSEIALEHLPTKC